MVGEACVVGGACMAWGVHSRYYEIRSMNGQYASYWNAFLFHSGKMFDMSKI